MGLFSRIWKKEKKEAKELQVPSPLPKTESQEAKTESPMKFGGVFMVPHVTEKSVSGNEVGKYIFRVPESASKVEIKRAVETQYGVPVTGVNISRSQAKKRRVGRTMGWKAGYVKAIVTLEKGKSINLG